MGTIINLNYKSIIPLQINDLKWIRTNYPQLKYDVLQNQNEFTGNVEFNMIYKDIPIHDQFKLLISLIPNKNSMLPTVKEIGGRIQNIATQLKIPKIDLHINKNDDSFCLCIYEKEKEFFPNGFSFQTFFEKILNPTLYWLSYYEKYHIPPWETYAHGLYGYLELYGEDGVSYKKLKQYDDENKKDLFTIINMKDHHLCLCGSNKKMKNCHPLLLKAINKLKKEKF